MKYVCQRYPLVCVTMQAARAQMQPPGSQQPRSQLRPDRRPQKQRGRSRQLLWAAAPARPPQRPQPRPALPRRAPALRASTAGPGPLQCLPPQQHSPAAAVVASQQRSSRLRAPQSAAACARGSRRSWACAPGAAWQAQPVAAAAGRLIRRPPRPAARPLRRRSAAWLARWACATAAPGA